MLVPTLFGIARAVQNNIKRHKQYETVQTNTKQAKTRPNVTKQYQTKQNCIKQTKQYTEQDTITQNYRKQEGAPGSSRELPGASGSSRELPGATFGQNSVRNDVCVTRIRQSLNEIQKLVFEPRSNFVDFLLQKVCVGSLLFKCWSRPCLG